MYKLERIFCLTFLIALLSFNSTFGQSSKSSVVGQVLEPEGEAMEYVNAILHEKATSDFVKGVATEFDGLFLFTDIPPGEYYVELSFVGFKTRSTDPFVVKQGDDMVNIGKITIEMESNFLGAVEVTAEKSASNISIDRKTYNVEKDIISSISSATEVLRNLPSVTTDVNGAISLRGSPNVTFFINGRPSPLMRANPTAALQQIPANSIARIEIITNPSAKYTPRGIGGIINIVLIDDYSEGFNGTVSGNVGNLGRYNGNLTLNYGMDKVNYYASYGIQHSNIPRMDIENTINRDGFGNDESTFDRDINADRDKLGHILNAGMTYDLTDNTMMEISGNYLSASAKRNQNMDAVFTNLIQPSLSNTSLTDRNLDESEFEIDVGLALEHVFPDSEDHTLAFEYVYATFNEKEDSYLSETFTDANGLESLSQNHVLIGIEGPTHEVALEYAKPLGEDTEIEAGYVGEFMQETLDFLGETKTPGEDTWVIDPSLTNKFIFTQHIHALYGTFGHAFGNVSFLAGLRAEQALVSSELSDNTIIPNDYFKLYPTLHLNYELGDYEELQLSYSKRVRRADSDEQNPFPEFTDNYTRDVGNPSLKPEIVHSFEFNYALQTDKISFFPTLYYRYKVDAFTEVSKIIDNNITETSFTNLNTDQSAGFEFIVTGNLGKFMNYNFSANTFYQQIDATDLGFSANKGAFSWDAKLSSSFRITNSTRAQVNAYYRSGRITPQGTLQQMFLVNAGLRQDILKNRASIVLTVSDIFGNLNYETVIDTPSLYQRARYGRNSQAIYLGFIYHFAKQSRNFKTQLNFEDQIDAGKKVVED